MPLSWNSIILLAHRVPLQIRIADDFNGALYTEKWHRCRLGPMSGVWASQEWFGWDLMACSASKRFVGACVKPSCLLKWNDSPLAGVVRHCITGKRRVQVQNIAPRHCHYLCYVELSLRFGGSYLGSNGSNLEPPLPTLHHSRLYKKKATEKIKCLSIEHGHEKKLTRFKKQKCEEHF